MAQLTKLGIQNFRVFKDMTEFDFAPITLLTGANNSGKSSVLKALSLLKNSFDKKGNIEKLNFEGLDLGTYEMNVNDKEKEIVFRLPFDFITGKNVVIDLYFKNERICKMEIICETDSLIMISNENDIITNFTTYKNLICEQQTPNELEFTYDEVSFKCFQSLFDSNNDALTKDELTKLDTITGEKIYKNKLIEYIAYPTRHFVFDTDLLNILFNHLYILSNFNHLLLVEHNEGNGYWTTNFILENDFAEILPAKINQNGKLFFNRLVADLQDGFKNLFTTLNFQYLTAHKANQQIIHTVNSQKTDFSVLLAKYSKLEQGNKKIKFVEIKLESMLGITDKLIVENINSLEAYIAYLGKDKKDENKKPLASFGFGVTQLITLLMQIAVSEKGQTIIIEEPETNLHPKLQTQLAELFVEVHTKFGIRFIIETHSEHLIRGLQLEVAKGLKADNLNMYYLNNVGAKERIEFQLDGGINFNKIGEGLFDNAYKIQYELVNHQFKKFLDTFTKLKATSTSKTIEEINEDVEKELQNEINFFITGQNITTYKEKVKDKLKDAHGADRTHKIDVQTFEYLASAEFLMEHTEKCNLSDYSPAVLQYGRAVENELKNMITIKFVAYLSSLIPTKDLSIIPNPLGGINVNNVKDRVDKDNTTNLGFFLNIFAGLERENPTGIPARREFDIFLGNEMFDTTMFWRVISNNLLVVGDKADISKPLGKVKELRDKSAHTGGGDLDKTSAENMQTLVINFFQQWISAKL